MKYLLRVDTVARQIRFIGVMWLLCAGGFLPAHAYVLDSAQILDRTVKAIGSSGAATVHQSVVLHAAAGEGEAPQVSETIRYLFPGRFRSDIQTETVHRIQVWAYGDQVTVINDQIPAEGEEWFDRYKDLMLYQDVASMEALLQEAGVNTSVSSFGRFEGRLAYVIGALYPDDSVPQLWIDKETFVPFRWILSGRDTDLRQNLREIRYQGWHKSGGTWYPLRIAFLTDDLLVREIQIDLVQPQTSLPEEQFDVSRLRWTYQRRVADPGETTGEDEEVQRTIEDFKRIYEP